MRKKARKLEGEKHGAVETGNHYHADSLWVRTATSEDAEAIIEVAKTQWRADEAEIVSAEKRGGRESRRVILDYYYREGYSMFIVIYVFRGGGRVDSAGRL